jgi:hypothetical protein
MRSLVDEAELPVKLRVEDRITGVPLATARTYHAGVIGV